MNIYMCVCHFGAFSDTKDMMLLQILEWLIKETSWWQFNLEDYNLLIASYGKQGEPDKAESLLEKMNGAGLAPTVATYTSLIEGFARKGLYARAESLLKRLQESGPLPTKATYQTIISMFCRGGQYEAAEKIFKSMTEGEGLKPDARMYNYMIHMYGKAGKAAEAQALIRQMKGLGLPMSAVTFNSLMSFQKTVPGAEATLRQVLCHKTRAGYLFFFPSTELMNWNLWQKPTYSGSDLTKFGFQSGLF
jgi:pentatricopeptide repeat protein